MYEIQVIEYQRRGLPHAHIVVCYRSRPTTAVEVDAVISCELSAKEGTTRTLVLRRMVHRCTNQCHPDGDTSKCKNGFPFTFQDETDFDRRGYPHHRRRSCGGHCPACTRGGDLCVNQLIVEYSPRLLQLWDGHLNVKFAGNVDLFEYLYKYMFKGPDFARYTVGQENSVDEISDWLRGRYVCATEAAWRIFGPPPLCRMFTRACERRRLGDLFRRRRRQCAS